MLGVHLDRLVDLHREFPRRRQDQCTDLVTGRAGRRAGMPGQAVEQGQRETRRFAGAGLGATHDVVAGEDDRNRLALDRRRFGVAGIGDGLQDFRDETEFGKRHGYVHVVGADILLQCTMKLVVHYTSRRNQRFVR